MLHKYIIKIMMMLLVKEIQNIVIEQSIIHLYIPCFLPFRAIF